MQDSREPHLDAGDHEGALFAPWRIVGGKRVEVPCERVTLREGDYSLPGCALWKPIGDDGPWRGEPFAVIERKALGDAISTVIGGGVNALGEATANRDRFAEELGRMREYAFRTIVIEGTMGDVQREASEPGRRFSAHSVLASYLAFAPRFGVQVLWAGSRGGAEYAIGTMLARIWDEYVGGPACKKAQARGDAMPWIGAGIRAEEK